MISRSARSRLIRFASIVSLAAGLASPLAAVAQEAVATSTDPVIIAPHTRRHVIWPHPRPAPTIPVKVSTVATQVSIDDQVASTTLVMTLQNVSGQQQESQVLVPVPDGATIRSFGIDGMGAEPTAKILPRDEARRIYESIVRRSRDPGLLEFVGYGALRSSVFPVPAHGTQTVRITYDNLLTAERTSGATPGDRIDYVLPRSDTADPGTNWSLSMDLRSKRPISTVYSPSHEIALDRIDEKHVRVKTVASNAGAGSFRMSYLLTPEKDGLTATVLAYPDSDVANGEGGYFLLLAGLPAAAPDDRKTLKREVTVVIDRSGSMRGEKMKQAREAAVQVLEGLKDGERFNIIDYSDSIASFEDKTVVKDGDSMAKARRYLEGITANGGTNIHDSLLEALRQEPAQGMLPVVLFLTDGLPTVGQTGESAIRDAAAKANAAKRRIFTFGVGFDVNAPLLTGIARGSRATSTFVLPEEDVEVKVGQVFRRLSGPVMSEPKLAKTGDVRLREMQPAELPDLFDGDQLVVLGQYTGKDEVNLRLSGSYLGKERTFEIKFDPGKASARNAYVGRLWATRKIASLIEQIRLAGADAPAGSVATNDPKMKELVDEVVRLSTKWGILTEYTAFLAIEPGAALARNDETFNWAPPPASAPAVRDSMLRAKVAENFQNRAIDSRGGKGAVTQEKNLSYQVAAQCLEETNRFWDKDMNRVALDTVCQVQDQSLFRRGGRWVDGRLLSKEHEAPEVTVEFATDAYFQLCDELATQNRQGILAQDGDVYLQHNGKRVLVKGGAGTGE